MYPTLAREKSLSFARRARLLVAYLANLPTFSTNSRGNACLGPIACGLRYRQPSWLLIYGDGSGVYSGESVSRPLNSGYFAVYLIWWQLPLLFLI